MLIQCENLEELKLLVKAIDLKLISDSERYKSGFGTGGVCVLNKAPSFERVLPISETGEEGVCLRGDKMIITPHPKEFAWFMEKILHMNKPECVALYEDVPFAFMDYLATHPKKGSIKDELLFICDWLISRETPRKTLEKETDWL